jgi:cytosine/adenosine deaminase-related metal-dependent hydrolase
MDDQHTEIEHGHIVIADSIIESVNSGPVSQQLKEQCNTIIDAKGCAITPGLVNTHHHLYQSITRGVPKGQDALLFGWLQTLYPIWQQLRSEDVYNAARLGLAELAMTGCTFTADHHYLYPNDVRLDDTIAAAHSVGLRLLATRGSMSIGESDGGLPPDTLVENEEAILEDCIRVIDQHHQAQEGAMIQIGIAPCSPFSVSTDLMKNAAVLARDKSVRLHTHLAENTEDVKYSLETFGCLPGQYAAELGWVGDDVWHAHCVQLNDDEIKLFSETQTGVSHCPGSNCRLGSGIAPIVNMRKANVPLSIGVDGSASSDIAHMLNEARQCLLLQRVKYGANSISARDSLYMATRGGAQVLGRNDLGQISPGYRADIAIWDLQNLHSSGSWDPISALILSGPQKVKSLLVEGKVVINDFEFLNLDIHSIIKEANNSMDYLKNKG